MYELINYTYIMYFRLNSKNKHQIYYSNHLQL